ncbi:TetR/AcrR family transcriptional regulator [Tsukamurella paurometabola]|uniref:TetR family transcriptional regulator n=1 Tax=Tsukamurella paurometabola TaxID=2061 RepID=A0ABS5NGZ9_TSUPA|nr:TetR/AcrR family transcriptional regulator [Tsukamurella paurometabola]MBS4103300.1 TetR family transcriptional regulator [Tsukamurella paurometabola]
MRPENSTDGQRSFIEEARRAQILAAAVDVLAEAGFGAASLARIAERAGISKGVISYHFDGKDDLLRQVVISLYQNGAAAMVPRIEAETTALGRVHAYIESNLEFLDTARRHITAMIEVVFGLRDADDRPAFSAEDGDNASVAPLAELLREGQATGELGEFDPWIMAQQIRDSIDGAANRAARDPDLDLKPYARHLIDLYLRAVQPSPPTHADD